jgi:hypothetical protein
MTLQEAFDAGFELCKRYIDAEVAAVAARVSKLEGRSPAETERELGEALRKQMESRQ